MKLMMITVTVLVVCICSRISNAGPLADNAKTRDNAFIDFIIMAKSAQATVVTKDRAMEAVNALEQLRLKQDDPGYSVYEYFKCRLLVVAASNEKAEKGFLELLSSRSVAPEAALGLLELKNEPRKTRIGLENCLSEILPLSVWRNQFDAQTIEILVDLEPPLPIVPKLDRRVLITIAKKYEQAGLFERAWQTYIEAIYGGLAPGWIGDRQREQGWFSSDTTELWAHAADNAWKAGEHQLAYDYLAKSVIFGPESQIDRARNTLKAWAGPNGKRSENEIGKEQRRQTIEEIAKLYAELNAHPRALEVIREYKTWLDNPDALYEKYAKDWRAVVKSYSRVTKNIVLYGTKISDNIDPATIRIPFACSKESVKAVKESVIRVLEKSL